MIELLSKELLSAAIAMSDVGTPEAEIARQAITVRHPGGASILTDINPNAMYLHIKQSSIANGTFSKLRAYLVPTGVLFSAATNELAMIIANGSGIISDGQELGLGSAERFIALAWGSALAVNMPVFPSGDIVLTLDEDRTGGTLDSVKLLLYGTP